MPPKQKTKESWRKEIFEILNLNVHCAWGDGSGTSKAIKELEVFIAQELQAQKKEINKKWERKRIRIPKGANHPVHDICEVCEEKVRQEIVKMIDKETDELANIKRGGKFKDEMEGADGHAIRILQALKSKLEKEDE